MSEFLFRDGVAEDASALAALDARCFPPDVSYPQDLISWFLGNSDSRTIVAERGGLAGFIIVAMIERHAGEVVTIDVDARHRRQHLATLLMEEGERWVRSRGGEWIYLEVDQDNLPALTLYQQRGYEIAREFSEGDVDRYLMMKALE